MGLQLPLGEHAFEGSQAGSEDRVDQGSDRAAFF